MSESPGHQSDPDGSTEALPDMAGMPRGEAPPFAVLAHEQPGATIGRFRLLEKVGEGGFGVVYVAEQREPVKRRVALKIIKLGMDTRSVVARFEAERQALAMMDHPNISKVFDAGATDTGRPYFVMELVRGIPITTYCDQNSLPPVQRLRLFIDVCHAIQHAHQKGVIHRDIKPSNILVTLHDGVPVPKVIDFGIAKATQGDLSEKTIYTQFQQFIGTPAYMSPEQAEMSGLDIDTRSDIYSLGVLLYELLTGLTPFDARELLNAGMDEMRRRIRETDPIRPSNRLSGMTGADSTSTARRRGMDAHHLVSLLRGDLDWIVMKCLEKDRTRRYETANALAVEIRRYLNDEPILARPPGGWYRLQKSFRRNRGAYAAGIAVAAALLLGIAASSWEALREARATRQAVAAREHAEASERLAVAAQARAEESRRRAQAAELDLRRRAYASDMNVAANALRDHNLGRAEELLELQRPAPGQSDLRGWEWRYLWQQTRSDALVELCRKSEPQSLAVSPDGRLLALGICHAGGVFLFDLHDRREIAHLLPNMERAWCAFSPVQPLLAVICDDPADGSGQTSHVLLWNTASRQVLRQFTTDGLSAGITFAADGQSFATATSGPHAGHVARWRVSDGQRLAFFPAPDFSDTRCAVAFATNPDLSIAACEGPDDYFYLLDLHDGHRLWEGRQSDHFCTGLAFSPDGKTLASASGFNASPVQLWDVPSGKLLRQMAAPSGWVGSMVFSHDGQNLTGGCSDQAILTWDIRTGACIDTLRGHRHEVWRLALLPDNRTLASVAKDGSLCLWDTTVPHQSLQFTLPKKIDKACFYAEGRSVLAFEADGPVTRWSGPGFQQRELLLDLGPGDRDVQFSTDGRFLASATPAGELSVYDMEKRTLLRALHKGPATVRVHCFLPNRHLVYENQTAGRMLEWDPAADQELQSWPSPAWPTCAPSPDGRHLASFTDQGDIFVRDLQQQTTARHDGIVEANLAGYDPTGRYVAVASTLGIARVWNADSFQEVRTLGGFLNAAMSTCFSPDGARLVVSANHGDEALRLWSVDGWLEVFSLQIPGQHFGRVAFSPDGNTLGRWGTGVVHLYQAPSWAQIEAADTKRTLTTHSP